MKLADVSDKAKRPKPLNNQYVLTLLPHIGAFLVVMGRIELPTYGL